MSILLEALKKSERQRRLGETPTLDTGMEPQYTPGGLNHWIPLALLVVSAGIMAWFGWQQIRPPGTDGSGEVVSMAAESAAESAEQPTATPSSQRPRTPTENFQGQDGDEAGTSLPPTYAARANEQAKDRLGQSFNNFKADPSQETRTRPAARSEIETRPEIPPAAENGIAKNAAAEPAARPRRSRMARQVPDPISYWELPQGVRDSLPELRITVLVYAESPEDRFLLADGMRLVEKDELQSGLVLEEIRRDGAVFLYRNYRFLVKG